MTYLHYFGQHLESKKRVVGILAPPARFPPYWNRASQLRLRKVRDVLNLTKPDFTTFGHILTFPGQVKQKWMLFWKINVFANSFWTRKDREERETPSYSPRQDASKHRHVDPERSISKFDLRSVRSNDLT